MKYTINCSKLVYAKLTADSSAGVTYGEVKQFSEPMEVQIASKVSTGTLYGGGVKVDNSVAKTGYDVTVQVTKLTSGVRQDIYGETYDSNGVLVEKSTDVIPYIALGLENELTDGEKGVLWFLKGKAQPSSQTVKQSEDNRNYSTDSIKIEFIPRAFDKEIRLYGDTSAGKTFTLEDASTFLESVPTTTTYPSD